MARLGMVIDTAKCVGCSDCVVACKAENGVPAGFFRDWLTEEVRGKFPTPHLELRSERCNHCDDPPCVTCCPTGASHVHPWGGVILVDHDACVGCKACIASCPYNARFLHPEGYADKCTFCIHRVEKGRTRPVCRCVRRTACISATSTTRRARSRSCWRPGARHVLLPEAGTGPRVVYLTA